MESNTHAIPLGQLFAPAIKRWWVILIAVIMGAVLMFAYTTLFVSPSYTTKAMLGVTNINMTAYQDSLIGQTISKECSEILTANITLERAADELNDYTFPENGGVPYRVYTSEILFKMIKTTTTLESRYITVEVSSGNAKEAKIVCDFITKAFCDVLKEEGLMNGADGKIIHHPVEPISPSSPNKTTNVLLGGIIGFVISIAVFLVIGFVKDSIDGEDWLISSYKDRIPMLAVIPDANSPSGGYKKYSKKYGYGYGYGNKQTK